MTLEFSGELWYWRGPAPYYFVRIPDDESAQIREMSGLVSYGWGVIPVVADIGASRFTTSLFPKDGRYLVPVKAMVRKAEGLEVGHTARVRLAIGL